MNLKLSIILPSAIAALISAQSAAAQATATQLPNGIEVQLGTLHERITALRDDVLRICVTRTAAYPEDASWAVLPAARQASVPVTPIASPTFGFRTKSLAVEVDKLTLKLTIRDSKGAILQQDARPIRFDGDAFRVYKSRPLDEHYFGLGDKTGSIDRRDQAFTLWNTDAYRFQESTDPIYKAIPYFMTFRAGTVMGVLMDNTWRSSFDFGKEAADAYSFGSSNGPLDYYIFLGPSPKQVVETYAWLTGLTPLPPLWSLGFQQSRYSYMTQARVLEVANRLRDDRIPADALYLDIDYQDQNRPFTVNTTAFPDLPGLVAQLHKDDFHLVVITDLHIANLPNHNYAPYDTGIAGDHFVKNPDGSVYTGKVWPGLSVFPDFTRHQSRAWWGTLYRDFAHMGIDGFWNDMNEPSVFEVASKTMPETVLHRIDEPGFQPRNATHAEIHNLFGMENSRATFEGLKTLNPDVRPFVLTRASYAGGQRYAATWTGDDTSSWNHLRLTTPMIENLGLSGFALVGADVGGFAGSPSPGLLTRWIEVSAFQPIDRDHATKGSADHEPWVGGTVQEDIRRRFIEERYRLMPYLYTVAEETSRTGLPIVRPLFLEFPEGTADRHPIDIDLDAESEFLFGPDLLIAPAPFPESPEPYPVEFPSRDWYNYWTGERVPLPPMPAAVNPQAPAANPEATVVPAPPSLTITPELAKLPVFVRAGSILPIAPLVQSTEQTPQGPLTLRVYLGNNEAGDHCAGTLYQDDGKSYAYQHGSYLRMTFACQQTTAGLQITISPHEGTYPAWWKEINLEVFGLPGKPTPVTKLIPDDGKGQQLTLQ